MACQEKVTFFKFYSGMRSFLSKLLKSPIESDIPEFMKMYGLSRKKIIDDLLFRDVIERHERILDQTNSDQEKPTYSVKYKVKRKNFERKMHRLYSKYFENNKKTINECDCGDCGCFDSPAGATNCDINAGHPDVLFGGKKNSVLRREISPKKKSKKRNIRLTEEQFRYINEFFNTPTYGDKILYEEEGAGATGTGSVGAIGDYTANGLQLDPDDPAYDRKAPLTTDRIEEEANKMTISDFYDILMK